MDDLTPTDRPARRSLRLALAEEETSMVAKTVVAVPQLSDGSVEHGEVPPSPIDRQRSPKEGLLQDTRQRSSTEGLLQDTRGSSGEQPRDKPLDIQDQL